MRTKKINILIALFSLAFVTVSCDQEESVPRAPKATVELTEESVTISESGAYPTLTFTQDIPTIPQIDDHLYVVSVCRCVCAVCVQVLLIIL